MAVFGQSAQATVAEVDEVVVARGGSNVFSDLLNRTGSVILDDGMNNGDPFTGPNFANGTQSTYVLTNLANQANANSAVSESGGHLFLDSQYGALTNNATKTSPAYALGLQLQTNTTAGSNGGLNLYSSFAAGALFVYNQPSVGSSYGVRLTDSLANRNDIVDLRVINDGSGSSISFRHQDFATGTITDTASVAINAAPSGTSFLGLALGQKTANTGVVNGMWGFFDVNGQLLDSSQSIGSTTIFHSEDHTRFELRSVEAVPEPETYAMLLVGLGLMTVIAGRRKQK
jgi:hypothetical protein